MNGKRYSSLLFGLLAVSLILLGIPLKASAYHSGSESDLAANPELVAFRNYRAGSVDPLAINPELIAYRSYRAGSVDELALNPELAISRSYSVSGSPVLKVDSVRWSALGFYYAKKMAMLRGAEADSARWVAMGTFYSFDPYRYALGLYYAHLASNPELLSLQQYETCGC
jgi:hypothetical protein